MAEEPDHGKHRQRGVGLEGRQGGASGKAGAVEVHQDETAARRCPQELLHRSRGSHLDSGPFRGLADPAQEHQVVDESGDGGHGRQYTARAFCLTGVINRNNY